jgi:hypothetical protein
MQRVKMFAGCAATPLRSQRSVRSPQRAKPSQRKAAQAKTLARVARLAADVARPTPSTIGVTANGNANMTKAQGAIAPGSCARLHPSSMRFRWRKSLTRRAHPSQPARGSALELARRIRAIGTISLRLWRGTTISEPVRSAPTRPGGEHLSLKRRTRPHGSFKV